jgi:saccharopine dehydrogenase (NAD+, L-lysine-forming)
MRILILGCGGVGSNAARQMAARHPQIEYVVGDRHLAAAERLAGRIGSGARPIEVDVHDLGSLDAACEGVDLIFNAVGPFYRNAAPVIEAALRHRIDYLDVNDDHDVAERLFADPAFAARVADAGIRMIVGCGFAPGMTNVMTRYACRTLQQVDAIHLALAVPFVPTLFTPAVLAHMFHITAGSVTQVIDGQLRQVPGWSGGCEVPFMAPFGTYPAYYFGHGETVSLAHFIPGVKELTNRLAFFPPSGSEKWRALLDQGFAAAEVIPELGISPAQYIGHHLKTAAAQAYFSPDPNAGPSGFANRVEVEGMRNGDRVCVVCEVHGAIGGHRARGEEAPLESDATPTCARIGMEAFVRGEVLGKGLLAPEVAFDAERFLAAALKESGLTLLTRETVVHQGL